LAVQLTKVFWNLNGQGGTAGRDQKGQKQIQTEFHLKTKTNKQTKNNNNFISLQPSLRLELPV
jgi:hypothetical protein